MSKKIEFGMWGEQLAHRYLKEKGYKILFRNWRSRKAEVDLIAYFEHRIIFIEVKTRENTNYGEIISFITNKKIALLRQAIEDFLNKYNLDLEAQIDIVCIEGDKNKYNIEWIEHAID